MQVAQEASGVSPAALLRGHAHPHRRPGPRHRVADACGQRDDAGGLGFGPGQVRRRVPQRRGHHGAQRTRRTSGRRLVPALLQRPQQAGRISSRPNLGYAAQWTAAIDTADPTGDTELVVAAGEKLTLAPRSLLVLRKTALAHASRPLSTYRLQMRGDSFTFADAENLLEYLDALGVSHLYLSPILTAARGFDARLRRHRPHRRCRPHWAAPTGLARLSSAARSRGMGLIVDIVPNHVGVDDPQQNAWWWDVLTHGREFAVCVLFRYRLGPRPGRPGRAAGPGRRRRRRSSEAIPPTARTTAPSGGATESAATGGSSPSPRWPGCARRTARCSMRPTRRSNAGSPRDSSTGCASIIRTDCPIPQAISRWLRELVGPQAWIVDREDPRRRRSRWIRRCPSRAPPVTTRCAKSAACSSIPRARAPLTDLFDSTGVAYGAMPDLARRLKAEAVTDTLSSELARLRRDDHGGHRRRSPRSARRGRDADQPRRGLPLGLPGTVGGAAHRIRRRRRRATGLRRASRDRRDGTGRQHRDQRAATAAVRCGDREVDGGLPVLPRRATGLAQRGGRRAPAFRRQRRRVPPTCGGAGTRCGRTRWSR